MGIFHTNLFPVNHPDTIHVKTRKRMVQNLQDEYRAGLSTEITLHKTSQLVGFIVGTVMGIEGPSTTQ